MQSNILPDQELVRQFIEGNQSSFEVLLKRHKQKIFSTIYFMVRDREIAEDLFQETFLKVITTLKNGRYNEENKFSAWVARIAHNLVIDYFRMEKHMPKIRDKEEMGVFDRMKNHEMNGSEAIIHDEQKLHLRNMLNTLPDEQREVVIMRIYADLSFKEIAEITNVSINTALGRMRYALINLREIMKEKKIDLHV